MDKTKQEIIDFIAKKNIKLIHLIFCDVLGKPKNITIAAYEFEKVYENGIAFDASVFHTITKQDTSQLFLFPDTSTFSVLACCCGEKEIQFYCDIKYENGTHFEGDSRYLLKNAVKEAREQNLECMFSLKCQFSIFEKNTTSYIPYDTGGYLDTFPFDKCAQIRNEICFALQEMAIEPKTAFHQKSPGQNQIDFKHTSALKCADDFLTYQSIAEKIAFQKNAFACFLPKPLAEKNGNGIHIDVSLFHQGKSDEEHSIFYESFIAGILNRMREMSVFFNTTEASYKRFETTEIPKYITWSHQYRSQLIYIASINEKIQPLELVSADSCLNPYLAFTLFIYAGLEGITKQLSLPSPCNLNLYTASQKETQKYQMLPNTLKQAVEIAKNSTFIQGVLPKEVVQSYLQQKQ